MTTEGPGSAPAGLKGWEDWFSPGRFAALLGLLILACFPQVVTGLEVFVFGDSGQFAYPVAFYHREAFWRGKIPLWNPLSSCGLPFLAQWNTLTLYPLSLFYLLLPMPWSFEMFCLGHLFLAGMGMYFLAYRWTGSRLAAAAAGTIFSFNGLTWYGLMWPHLTAALGWMPWVVLAMERAWRHGGRAVVLAALAAAMQMLSGGAEAILQTWMVLGALWVIEFFRGEIPRGKLAARALEAGGLMAGLTAAQMLPFLDLLAHSQRNAGYSSSGIVNLAAMPWTGWANYLVPLFRCVSTPQGVFVQAGQTWTGSYYLGVGAVALATLAVWHARNRRVWFLAGIAASGLLLALGSQGRVYEVFRWLVPPVRLVRFPVKFVMLPTFAVPLLAAYGLSWLQRVPAEDQPREWRRVKGLALVLAGLMTVIVWFAWKYPLTTGDFGVAAGNALVRAVFLVVILGCLGLLRRTGDLKLQRLLQTGLVMLLWFDVFTHAPNLSPTAPRAAFEPDAVRRAFNWDNRLVPGSSRAMQSKDAFWRMVSTGAADPELDIRGRRLSLSMNLNLLDHAAKFDGFYSSDLSDYYDVFKFAYFKTNEAARLKDFAGISHISNPTNILDWVSRDSFLPMITAGQKPEFADRAETLSGLLSDRFDPRHTVYLPVEVQGQVHAGEQPNVRIGPPRFSSGRLDFQVEADSPALVVVAQSFYHCWHCYVDGKPTQLLRANYAFQGFEVPAGSHRASLVYEDQAFLLGALLSLASALACGAAWLWWGRGRAGSSIGS